MNNRYEPNVCCSNEMNLSFPHSLPCKGVLPLVGLTPPCLIPSILLAKCLRGLQTVRTLQLLKVEAIHHDRLLPFLDFLSRTWESVWLSCRLVFYLIKNGVTKKVSLKLYLRGSWAVFTHDSLLLKVTCEICCRFACKIGCTNTLTHRHFNQLSSPRGWAPFEKFYNRPTVSYLPVVKRNPAHKSLQKFDLRDLLTFAPHCASPMRVRGLPKRGLHSPGQGLSNERKNFEIRSGRFFRRKTIESLTPIRFLYFGQHFDKSI